MRQIAENVSDVAGPGASIGGGLMALLAAAEGATNENVAGLMVGLAGITTAIIGGIISLYNARRQARREDVAAAQEELRIKVESERVERGDGNYRILAEQREATIAELSTANARQAADLAKLQADNARLAAQVASFQQGAK